MFAMVLSSLSFPSIAEGGYFGGFGEIAVDGAADDVAGGFIEVVVEQLGKLQILRPQDLIEELALEADHYGGVALAREAVWPKVMAADQCQKELALPWIGQGKLEFHCRLRCGGKLGVETFERATRRLHLAMRLGGFEQGLNLVDFVDEFVACHGRMKSKC